jgi:hypothetical protein
MADFTIAEQAYIDLFNRIKESMPLREVSVFQQPITTREELLNTIVVDHPNRKGLRLGSYYNFTPIPGVQLIPQGKQKALYDYKRDSYPFWNLNTLTQFSDLLCTAIVNYMPLITLPDPTLLLSTSGSMLDEFKLHYEKSIDLLLAGPPHANQHTINPILAAEWIDAQKTPERKRLAKLLLDNTIYISHSKMLAQIHACVEKVHSKLVEGPITFIVGTKDKSNYYISLLFYHYWTQAGLPVHAVKPFMDGLVPGNLIDIDEMAYSGSQTLKILADVYMHLIKKIHKALNNLNAVTVQYNTNLPIRFNQANKERGMYGYQNILWPVLEKQIPGKGLLAYREPVRGKYVRSYSKSNIFVPLMLIESILNTYNINYIVLRVFCSEMGQKGLLQMPAIDYGDPPRPVKPPFHLVIGELIPAPETLFGKEDALKMGFLFAAGEHYPAAPVYFNHKVADLPSTYLNPYSYGVIPDRLLFGDPLNSDNELKSLTPEQRAIYNSLENPTAVKDSDSTTFLPFINFCQKDLRPIPSSRKNLFIFKLSETNNRPFQEQQLPQIYRCPYPWYKNIDYDKGTYTPPPELRAHIGGTRRVKRRSTKRRMTRRR